jgi:hypothetical protein
VRKRRRGSEETRMSEGGFCRAYRGGTRPFDRATKPCHVLGAIVAELEKRRRRRRKGRRIREESLKLESNRIAIRHAEQGNEFWKVEETTAPDPKSARGGRGRFFAHLPSF